MTLRESVQQKPTLLIGATAAAVLIAITITLYTLRSTPTASSSNDPKAFFSTDDGLTFFTDSASKIPPFDHNGKQAVAAMVFQAGGGGGKQFINHLERYTPEAIKAIHDYNAKVATAKSDPGPGPYGWINLTGKELKRPGPENKWTRIDDPNAHTILEVKPPNGITGQPTQIFP